MVSQSNDGKPQFVRVKGLRNTNINKLVMDKTGMIWVSSDDGLVRIDPATLQVMTLQSPDGLAISAYWPGAGAVTREGEVLFGGLGGLTVVRPAWYKKWDYKPPVVLTELSVGGRVQNAQRLNLVAGPGGIHLSPQDNQLNVEFAALDFSAPELNRYQYWLEGYDQQWHSSDANRRLATYANLPPGQYQLHLRGTGRSGVWSATRTFPIEVQAAWYQTWWSKVALTLGGLLLALLLLTALVQRRTHLLRLRQQQLQLEVNQRTSQLQAIQAELLAANQDMNHVNDDLALWVDTLRHLGEVGQEITAKLKISSVTEVLQRHVESLMNVAAMVLLRIEPEGQQSSLLLARIDGQSVSDFGPFRLDDDSFVAQVAQGRQELLLQKAAISGRATPSQSLFVPLVIDQRLLGVMAIESQPGEQYGERECLIFRTLCAYGAIALDNAEAYRQVGVTLKTLGDTQAQLVQQAKIASLGTLTAGVAHEINNPANFAYVGSYNLRQQLALFHRYLLDLSGPEAPADLLAALQARFDELGESLNVITEGATRIRDLVKDLRTFSRLDEADWKEVAIADSLSATVNLVRTQYAHQVEIIAELDANPTLMCWPAQLNQVFMNLIVNACQAIAKRPEPNDGSVLPHGRLVIRSRLEAQDWLLLEFEDNGIGMSAELIEHIFDPFFTTKGVGEGMGMGLSITLGIIDKHRGHIDVKSSPGQGSCFILRLPLSQQAIVKEEAAALPAARAA
jgi:signal transduction histidine kinase